MAKEYIHNSYSPVGMRIIFLASPMVTPVKGDAASERNIRIARAASVTCGECGDTFPAPTFDGNGSCPSCWDEAGIENEHSDGYHDAPVAACKACTP
jgi:hypothetical protein